MIHPDAVRRAAVLAYSPRSREYVRRALRSLGHAPLVFTNFDELAAMGPGASALDLLIVGDAPDTDSRGRVVLPCIRSAIGPNVPLLLAPLNKRSRVRRAEVAPVGLATASPRYFSELYKAIRSFLDAHGFAWSRSSLRWDSYSFQPLDRTVAFDGDEVQLDAVSFDVALEFFFNAGIPLTKRWLRSMLPSGEPGALWHRIDNIGCTVDDLRIALQLDASNGWVLEDLHGAGYQLKRTELPPALRPPARREPLVATTAAPDICEIHPQLVN